MSLILRTLSTSGAPLTRPDGTAIASAAVIFTLVDALKKQPVSLFDAVTGEYVVSEAKTATTNSTGEFSVDLWPNGRGEFATLYKVTIPSERIYPFYVSISDTVGTITLVQARTAVEAVTPQALSLFETLLGQVLALVGQATAPVTTTVNGLMTAADKVKLDGIASGANNYTHPSTHSPAIIQQDSSNRFVTDTEKSTWNGKESAIVAGTTAQYWRGDKSWQTLNASAVGLGNVTNESKSTMFTNPTFTGTVSGITASAVGLGNVTNESKSTMFASPTFTGSATAADLTVTKGATDQNTTLNVTSIKPTRSAMVYVSAGDGTTSSKFAALRIENLDTNGQKYAVGTYGSDDFQIYDTKAGASRLSIAPSGNVGVAATPNAWNSSHKAIELGAWGALDTDATNFVMNRNGYYNASGQWIYKNTGTIQHLAMDSTGGLLFFTAASGTAGNVATLAQKFSVAVDGLVTVNRAAATGIGAFVTGSANISDISMAAGDSAANGRCTLFGWKYNGGSPLGFVETYGSTAPLVFQSNGGNVGIGAITAPVTRLSVTGPTATTNTGGTASSYGGLLVTNATDSSLALRTLGSGHAQIATDGAGKFLSFAVGQFAEAARFTSAGRFLLNTTTDDGFSQAQINGTVRSGTASSAVIGPVSPFSNGIKSATTYRKLFTMPATTTAVTGHVILTGQVGGWTASQGKAIVDVTFCVRDAEYFAGSVLGTLANNDIRVYKEADNSYAVYAVITPTTYSTPWTLTLTGTFASGATDAAYVMNSSSETTTAPTGSQIWSLAANGQMSVNYSGVLSASGGVSTPAFTSTVAIGTAPMVVTSTTKVNNLNVDMVDSFHASQIGAASSLAATDSSGNLKLATGNLFVGPAADNGLAKIQSSNGVTLGNTANANATVLDWYEEGTFTPILTFGGVSTGITYNTQNGKYTRIGNRVFIQLQLYFTSKGSATGAAVLSGLPFNMASAYLHVSSSYAGGMGGSVSALGGYQLSGTTIQLIRFSAGAATSLADTDFTNATNLLLTIMYDV